MKFSQLTCENQVEALGVQAQAPVFGWALIPEQNGERQTAYRMVVRDDRGETVFDSGRRESAEQLDIRMDGGRKLAPMTRYGFSVTVWNQDGADFTADSWFLTGFMKICQWQSQWFQVFYPEPRSFRHEFTVERAAEIDYAYLFIGAVGAKCHSNVTFLNGQRVGDGVFFPGASEPFHAFYTAVDVKNLLLEGTNTVGMIAAYSSSAVLKIRYRDGAVYEGFIRVSEWKMTTGGGLRRIGLPGPVSVGKYEEYDAGQAFPHWTENGFDDSGWEPVSYLYGRPCCPLLLSPQFCLTKISRSCRPVRIERQGEVWFVDFGTNMSGFVTLHMQGRPGETIEIRHFEKLDEDGIHAKAQNPQMVATVRYTFATDGIETYTPLFSYTGFRYIEIHGYSGEVNGDSVEANFIHSDVVDDSRFHCSKEIVNRLNEVARQSFLSNLVDIPTDGPERERRGWTADAFAVSRAELIQFRMNQFYRFWFESMEDCQRGCGWIPVELPLNTDGTIDTVWPSAAVLIPYDVYEQTGDMEFARQFYGMMERWVDLLLRISDENYTIFPGHLGFADWASPESAGQAFIGMCYFFRCADQLAGLSAVLGKEAEAQKYGALAADIRASVNRLFLHDEDGDCYYDNGTQSACAHGLSFGLCPDHLRGKMLAHLVADIRRKGKHTTGFLAAAGLLRLLAENGYADDAYRIMCEPDFGGWVYAITHRRATTFPEHLHTTAVGSENHAFMAGSIAAFMYETILGIQPEAPGYRVTAIRPYCPADMEEAEGTVATRYGSISVAWVCRAGERRLDVTVPVGVTAHVTWDGQTVTVPSGSYRFG